MNNNENIFIKYYFYKYEKDENNNFGDGINPLIFNYFTNKKLKPRSCIGNKNETGGIVILGIGSIMQKVRNSDIVFGSGIISESIIPHNYNLPKTIKAVRGPLTRNKLLELGSMCPEIYGDPVLLLPFIINKPKIAKKYKIGIIPHYMDANNPLIKKLSANKNVLIINILSAHKPKNFIYKINSCDILYSSSLHGIIVGDAYNIPSYHLLMSDKVLGDNFKFKDYYLSVNRRYYNVELNNNTTLENLLNVKKYKCSINLSRLINNFPFIDKNIKNNSIKLLEEGYMNYIHKK